MDTYYTTEGNVRGCCGHRHRTIETAAACKARDARGCRSQGGYTDREIVKVADGVPVPLDDADLDDLEWYSQGRS